MFQICRSLQPQNSIHGKIRKVIFVLCQHLTTQRCPRDVEQVLSELGIVVFIVYSRRLERSEGRPTGNSVAFSDCLRVNFLNSDELFRFTQEFGSKDTDRGGTVSDFIILNFGDVDKDFGGGIVKVDRFEDGSTIVGDGDVTVRSGFWRTIRSDIPARMVHPRKILFMPLGPRVDLTKSPKAMAPTKDERRAFSPLSSVA